jgi:hypothetical protein
MSQGGCGKQLRWDDSSCRIWFSSYRRVWLPCEWKRLLDARLLVSDRGRRLRRCDKASKVSTALAAEVRDPIHAANTHRRVPAFEDREGWGSPSGQHILDLHRRTAMDSPEAAHNKDWLGQVKELAAGVSVQTQVANRVWLALITVALVAVLPRGTNKNPDLSLPFGFGTVDSTLFYPVAFSILAVLAVAFAAAHAQVIRAGVQAQKIIDSLPKVSFAQIGMDPRGVFDMERIPSLNRVAPLAQLAIGQFSAITGHRWWVRGLGVLYYLLLKVLSVLVYYGLPGLAVTQACTNASRHELNNMAFSLFAKIALSAALLALVHVFLSDVRYSYGVAKRLWRSDALSERRASCDAGRKLRHSRL